MSSPRLQPLISAIGQVLLGKILCHPLHPLLEGRGGRPADGTMNQQQAFAIGGLLRRLPPHIRQYAHERSQGGTGTRKAQARFRR